MQTRVDDKVARRFSAVAKKRGLSPYERLAQLVKDEASQNEPEGWDSHKEKLAALKIKPLPYSTVARDREEAGER